MTPKAKSDKVDRVTKEDTHIGRVTPRTGTLQTTTALRYTKALVIHIYYVNLHVGLILVLGDQID